MFGKLTWSAIPFDQPIPLITSLVVTLVLAGVAIWVWRKGWWPYLWDEYITSTDHKRIGIMYIVLALVMLVRGFADAIMMRAQQSLAIGASQGYLPPEHYNQIFSAHGTIMIFFMAMPIVIGMMNFVVPLQLGVRDVAFPTMNNVSFWLTASGALLINLSLVLGEFARTGWLGFPPLSEKAFSPGVGVDYYLVALQISGVGTVLTAVNFVTTILKTRAPGMSYLRMPIFCWTTLASNLLILAAFPVLTATLGLLMLDRYLGFHFFTNDGGGNSMLYMNLIWVWGHPEVYILVLPAFGIYSEVVSTFSGKPLFGYRSMVFATLAICILSFMVWLHHFFTMGAGADVNAVFGIASMVIAIPTGVKIFNWLFTMYGGRVRFTVPMHYRNRVHGHVRHRRTDRRAAGDPTGRFHRPQQPVPGRPLPSGDHRRRRVRGDGRLHLLVPQGVRLHARRAPRQDRVLVLVHRFPSRVHAALRARIVGRDAADAAHSRRHVEAVAGCRICRRCDYRPRDRVDGRSAALFHQNPRPAPRCHRRPVGWAHARMADLVAAAALQFRGASRCSRRGGLLDPQADRDPAKTS